MKLPALLHHIFVPCCFLAVCGALVLGEGSVSYAEGTPQEEAIIDGIPVDPSGSPVVELILQLSDNSFASCSGSVIGGRTILTAGHCVTHVKKIYVLFNGGTRRISAKSWWRHPGYKELFDGLVRNDLGIVRLQQTVPRGTRKLALSTRLFKRGEVFFIYGYGVTEDDTADELRGGAMRAALSNSNEIQAFLQSDTSITCSGDSGGPAVRIVKNSSGSHGEIVGTTSTGDVGCSFVSYFAPVTTSTARAFIKKYLQ